MTFESYSVTFITLLLNLIWYIVVIRYHDTLLFILLHLTDIEYCYICVFIKSLIHLYLCCTFMSRIKTNKQGDQTQAWLIVTLLTLLVDLILLRWFALLPFDTTLIYVVYIWLIQCLHLVVVTVVGLLTFWSICHSFHLSWIHLHCVHLIHSLLHLSCWYIVIYLLHCCYLFIVDMISFTLIYLHLHTLSSDIYWWHLFWYSLHLCWYIVFYCHLLLCDCESLRIVVGRWIDCYFIWHISQYIILFTFCYISFYSDTFVIWVCCSLDTFVFTLVVTRYCWYTFVLICLILLLLHSFIWTHLDHLHCIFVILHCCNSLHLYTSYVWFDFIHSFIYTFVTVFIHLIPFKSWIICYILFIWSFVILLYIVIHYIFCYITHLSHIITDRLVFTHLFHFIFSHLLHFICTCRWHLLPHCIDSLWYIDCCHSTLWLYIYYICCYFVCIHLFIYSLSYIYIYCPHLLFGNTLLLCYIYSETN